MLLTEYCLYSQISISIPKVWKTTLEKKSLIGFPTSFSPAITRSSSSARITFPEELVLLCRKYLTVLQKDLLSVTFISLNDEWYSYHSSCTKSSFSSQNIYLLSPCLIFRKQLLSLVILMIAFKISASMECLYLARK